MTTLPSRKRDVFPTSMRRAVLLLLLLALPWAGHCAEEASSIASGDLVFVKVTRHPELSTSVQVDGNGNISLPYVGNVAVGGLSEAEATSRVAGALATILKNPHVTVSRSASVSMPVSVESARTPQMTTQVVHLDNSSAEVLQKALSGMASPGGSVSAEVDTNTLILTDTAEVLQNMTAAIRELDQMETQLTQVHIEARIVEVSSEAVKEIGIRWSAVGDKLTGGYIPGARQDARLNGVRTFNDPTFNEQIANTDFRNGAGVGRRFLNDGNLDRRLQVPVQVGAPGEMYLGFMNKGIDLVALLDALMADNKAEMLASPYIRTVNHKTAKIKMTQEYPFTELGSAGLNAVASVKFLDIGIQLDVTPHVRKDPSGEAYIQLELKPEVSSATGVANGVPIRSLRSSNSVANVRDGQTLVIGGIVQRDSRNVNQRVPVLGDIPGLGALFRHKEKSKGNTELMIFVTPNVCARPENGPAMRELNLTQVGDAPKEAQEAVREKRKD